MKRLKIQSSIDGYLDDYIKTWIPGHYGEYGFGSEHLWKKTGSIDVYEYVSNSSVKMVKFGDSLYPINEKEYELIKDDEVTQQDVDLHSDKHMTDYTSY